MSRVRVQGLEFRLAAAKGLGIVILDQGSRLLNPKPGIRGGDGSKMSPA